VLAIAALAVARADVSSAVNSSPRGVPPEGDGAAGAGLTQAGVSGASTAPVAVVEWLAWSTGLDGRTTSATAFTVMLDFSIAGDTLDVFLVGPLPSFLRTPLNPPPLPPLPCDPGTALCDVKHAGCDGDPGVSGGGAVVAVIVDDMLSPRACRAGVDGADGTDGSCCGGSGGGEGGDAMRAASASIRLLKAAWLAAGDVGPGAD